MIGSSAGVLYVYLIVKAFCSFRYGAVWSFQESEVRWINNTWLFANRYIWKYFGWCQLSAVCLMPFSPQTNADLQIIIRLQCFSTKILSRGRSFSFVCYKSPSKENMGKWETFMRSHMKEHVHTLGAVVNFILWQCKALWWLRHTIKLVSPPPGCWVGPCRLWGCGPFFNARESLGGALSQFWLEVPTGRSLNSAKFF